jgi:hypothetical protein
MCSIGNSLLCFGLSKCLLNDKYRTQFIEIKRAFARNSPGGLKKAGVVPFFFIVIFQHRFAEVSGEEMCRFNFINFDGVDSGSDDSLDGNSLKLLSWQDFEAFCAELYR